MDEKPVNQHDVFRVPLLEDNTEAANVLVNQCKALVAQSRDTFWLDQATCDTAPVLCCLEQLAWSIFQQHIRRYGMDESNAMGCEYWVQCKNVSFPGNDYPNPENYCNGEEAVDLHYDKDEVVAEYFGLGMFPTLSTVTYLAGSVDAPPTMVLDRTYNDPDEKDISSILVSRPQVGKHLVFDGRLLHGAPSHFALRNLTQRSSSERLTFLVNVWVGHKPVGVRVLPNDMRSAINSATIDNSGEREKLPSILSGMELLENSDIEEVTLNAVTDLPADRHDPIELPFVGGKATWAEEDDASSASLVVATYVPSIESTTARIFFGAGLEAQLRYS